MATKNLLVTGATGKQGGALIDALLASPSSPYNIYALTRSPTSASALALTTRHPTIHLIQGDPSSPAPIFVQLPSPLHAIFSVTSPGGKDPSVEENQAIPLIDLALEKGVEHFVFTSADRGGPTASDGDDPTPVPHFVTKFNIERHLKQKCAKSQNEKKMRWTVLRPVAFYDNLTPDIMGWCFARMVQQIGNGGGNGMLNMIATSDIGRVAAAVLLAPEKYADMAITLVADSLSFEDMNRVFEEETGTPLPLAPGFLASFAKWMITDLGIMFAWFGEGGYGYDIKDVKAAVPVKNLLTFRAWLREGSKFEKKAKQEGEL